MIYPSVETVNLSQETVEICHQEGWAYGSNLADAYESELRAEQGLDCGDCDCDRESECYCDDYDPTIM